MVRDALISLVSNTVMFYITLYLFTKTISKAESGGIPFLKSGTDCVLTAAILPAAPYQKNCLYAINMQMRRYGRKFSYYCR